MRHLLIFVFIIFLFPVPALGQDHPILTTEGLEDFKLGEVPPERSRFQGLTTLRQELTEWEEGEAYHNVYLKLFQNGHYLGKARLDKDGRIDEFRIVEPRARYEGGFAVGSSWDSVQRVFPGVELAWTYLLDGGMVVASSPQVPGLQAFFSKEEYNPPGGRIAHEWLRLKETDIAPEARVHTLRLYRTDG